MASGATRTDLSRRRARLTQVWEARARRRTPGGHDPEVPDDVLASWRRSARSVDPDCAAAPLDDVDEVVSRWQQGATARGLRAIEDELRSVVDDGDLIAAVTDADGRIVWTYGSRVMQRAAARVNFVPGGRWDEASVGTNALALALRDGRPATVYSAEHFSSAVHGWVCYAVPVIDPDTRTVLGVLDLSTTWDRAHPLAMAAARGLGQALTANLPRQLGAEPGLVVRALGRNEVRRGGRPLSLSPRQAEIVVLLALHPEGLSLAALHEQLYGDEPVTTSTLKAEISHLRGLLGGAISSRPYRLTGPVSSDVQQVRAALDAGDTAAAVATYGGSLLGLSESPGKTEWRHYVDVAVREAVLASRDPAQVQLFAEHHPYDEQVQEHFLSILLPRDPRRPLALAGVTRAHSS